MAFSLINLPETLIGEPSAREASNAILFERNELVTSFESLHMGMGFFEFTPSANHQYFVEVRYLSLYRK